MMSTTVDYRNLSEEEKVLLIRFRLLDSEEQETILSYAEELSANEE